MLTIILLLSILTCPPADEFADTIMGPSVEIEGHGSGVIVYSSIKRSLILTNWHVINCGCGSPIAVVVRGVSYPAVVLSSDEHLDLALLVIDVGGLPTVNVATEKPKLLDEIWSVGFPALEGPTPSKGIVTALDVIREGTPHLRISAPIWYGSSGGGVFNRKGELVGIQRMIKVDMRGMPLSFMGYAIPMESVIRFLETPWEVDQNVGEESEGPTESDGSDERATPAPRVEAPKEEVEQDPFYGTLVF